MKYYVTLLGAKYETLAFFFMLNERFYLMAAIAIIVVVAAILTFNLFHKTAVWLEEGQFFPNSKANSTSFSEALAIDKDTIVVGDSRYSNPNSKESGRVFIYIRTLENWSEQTQLPSCEQAPKPGQKRPFFHSFGSTVAINSNTVLVGPYVFTRTGATWSQQAVLEPPPLKHSIRLQSVALDGDTAVVGYDRETHVFRRNSNTGNWSHETELKLSETSTKSGNHVAINGDLIADNSGCVFRRDANTGSWLQEAELTKNGRRINAWSVAISGNTVVLGTPHEDLREVQLTFLSATQLPVFGHTELSLCLTTSQGFLLMPLAATSQSMAIPLLLVLIEELLCQSYGLLGIT